MRSFKELLTAHGGEFLGTLPSVPQYVFDAIRNGVAPLCLEVSRPSGPAKFAFVNNSSLMSSAWETTDGPLVLMSCSLPARIYQFIRLTTLFDGHVPRITFRNPELREHFDEYSDPTPPLLRTAVDDFEDDAEFWATFVRNDEEIDRLYDERAKIPLESLWQTTVLACQLVAAHEFAHLREHHHRFVEYVSTHDQAPPREVVLRSLEMQADDFAGELLADALYTLNDGRELDLATPFFGLLSYGSSALFHLMDTRRTMLGGAHDNEAHVIAFLRSIVVRDAACRTVSDYDKEMKREWSKVSDRMYNELNNNLGCLVEVLVVRGELPFPGPLRHPGLNPFVNGSTTFRHHGLPRVMVATDQMYDGWNQTRELLFEFLRNQAPE